MHIININNKIIKNNSPNKILLEKQHFIQKSINEPMKPRSQTFDTKIFSSTKPIKINIQNIRRPDDGVKIKFRNDNHS